MHLPMINFVDASALTFGFINGAGQIWLDNVRCRGTETRLIDCPASPLGSHDCIHAEDAGVRCFGYHTGIPVIIAGNIGGEFDDLAKTVNELAVWPN